MKRKITESFLYVISVFLILICMISCKSNQVVMPQVEAWNSNYPYVLVHGMGGWGGYDSWNTVLPYFGTTTGSISKKLEIYGFECYEASVAPYGSAWDRACELYAQLMGTVVDYGEAHSKECHHNRFGTDYSKNRLVPQWDSEHKLNFVGHSFGGNTIRLLVWLLNEGSEEERKVTAEKDLSPLFKGNQRDLVYSVIAFQVPFNGVSAITINQKYPDTKSGTMKFLQKSIAPLKDRSQNDCVGYDLDIDVAAKVNKTIHDFDNIYYFSVPAQICEKQSDGNYVPKVKKDETFFLFIDSGTLIGQFKEKTKDGYQITDEWLQNDGICNTISAKAPFTEKSVKFNRRNIQPGIWNVYDPLPGDHTILLGRIKDPTYFYVDLFNLINEL